ncbi:class I adenylate-forming enzyme family protein [Candidatus Methylobacter oryzae]|uniref:Acyl--CoA ligase n=1 Tax=Candidatus Methylobacter oryzae TaxID=2497749 RepID=A0ABY3C6E1_9GAMM|nr:class I adenylate-forming enzyme family protein [Candidatus Methylobacter oryzae]TRW90812.1 acyl--CoA ligase [Candidatus Methylobacter oryzae]
MTLNLAEVFFQQAALRPEHPAILGPHEHTSTSYGALRKEIQTLAEQLQAAGIHPGMNIGLHYPGGQAYIAFTYALWACGACVTPIPMELATEEKQLIFQHIAIDAVISTTGCTLFAAFAHGESIPLTAQACLLNLTPLRTPPAELAGLNPAFIRFTSGTTGEAKGVILSHDSIFARIQAANEGLEIDANDRIVWLLSMAYHFAVSIVAYLSFGSTIILCKNSFGSTILQAANRHRATLIYAAPTHYELMSHDRSEQTLSGIRLAIVTTAYLRPDIAEAFYQRFGIAPNETYGIIEVGLPAVNLDAPKQKRGSVGRLLPSYSVKLDSPDENGIGEIMLSGPGLLDAYYQPWQARGVILNQHGGWLATGDLGFIDEDDYLFIVGRSKEMISVGGMKFFIREVETVLERHPAIQAACVFAVKARRLGETPMAHVVLADNHEPPDEAELKAYCGEHLAAYKIPDQFHWVDSLARTASGKLIRNTDKLLSTQTIKTL